MPDHQQLCQSTLLNIIHKLLYTSSLVDFIAPPSLVGLIVIPDPFLSGCQHWWVQQCLVGYPCRPNVCNLDAHVERSGEGRIWPTEEEAADVARYV